MKKQVYILVLSLLMIAVKAGGQCNIIITNPSAVCSPGTVDLTAGAVTAGSDAGLVFTYWTDAAASISLSNPNAVATSGTYYIKGTQASCTAPQIKPVTVTINPLPTITGTLSVCVGSTTTLTGSGTAHGTTPWSSASTGIATITSGGIVSGVSAGSSVITYMDINGCTKTATITVNAIPSAPGGSATQSVCGSGTVADLVASGSNINWYAASTGGSPLAGSVSLVDATHYFASQTSSGCESTSRLDVTVTITAIPSAPGGSTTQSFCGSGTIADLVASGSNIHWYAASTGGSPLAGTVSLVDATHYFASQTSSGCESTSRLDVTVTVNARPTITFTNEPGTGAVCTETDVTYTTQSGQSAYTWVPLGSEGTDYSITSGGASSDNTITLSWITSGNKTVNINYTNSNSCAASSPLTSQITPLNPVPVTPVFNFTLADTALCYGPANKWFTATSAGSTLSYTVNPSGTSSGEPGTMSSTTAKMTWKSSWVGKVIVTATATNSCAVKASTIGIRVFPTTLGTPASITGSTTVCHSQTGVSYSISAISYAADYVWTVPTGATFTGQGTTSIVVDFASASSGNITVHAHNSCVTGADKTLPVTVKPNPTAAISSPATVCQNSTSYVSFSTTTTSPITITYNIGGANQTTVNVAGSSSTDVLIPTTATGPITYNLESVVYQSGSSCSVSLSGTTTTTVSPTVGTPTAISISPGTEPTCQVTGSPTTNYSTTALDNTGFTWSLSTSSAGAINSSGVMTWTNGFAGNVDISVTANGCNSPSSPVTRPVSIIGNPSTPTPSASTICQGSSDTYYSASAINASTYTWTIDGSGNSISGTGTTGTATWGSAFSGIANIKVYAVGCPSYGTTTVTVRPTPAPSINVDGTGSASVCKDGTQPVINLINNQNATGIVTITYSKNGVNQTPVDVTTTIPINALTNTAGTYNYSLVNAAYKTGPSCQTSPSGSALVTVNALPAPTISGAAIQRINSTNLYTTESGMNNYSWSFTGGGGTLGSGGTSTDNTASYTWTSTSAKTVYVNYKDGNGCTAVTSSSMIVTVNPKPAATSVSISGSVVEGELLTGTYSYSDNGGYAEGTSTYRWLSSGTGVVATTKTYIPTSLDVGSTLTFEVTPVSTSPDPKAGNPVQSTASGAVTSSGSPVAEDVCIEGIRAAGNKIRGVYHYNYPAKAEGVSTYKWTRGTNPTAIGTAIEYTLTASDITDNADIFFEVIPVSSNITPKAGAPVKSAAFVKFTLKYDTYSVAKDTVILRAVPTGGVFSGPGVYDGLFHPSEVGISTNTINYMVNIVNTSNICAEQVSKNIGVVKPGANFDKPLVFCHAGDPVTISITGITPNEVYPGAPYPYTNKYIYYGFEIINSDLSYNSNEALIGGSWQNDTYSVTIDPKKLAIGNGVEHLYFYYIDWEAWSFLQIEKPIEVENEQTITSINNLKASYCASDPEQNITVDGLTSGLLFDWKESGGPAILFDVSSPVAKLRPATLGAAGKTYNIKYQYTSPNGCVSNLFSTNVTINKMPVITFTLKDTYNINGPAQTLVPSPLPFGAAFEGDGVSVNKFFPDIAGTGGHTIKYKIVDVNGCSKDSSATTSVRNAIGSFVNVPSVTCYRDTTYEISFSIPAHPGIINNYNLVNSKNSLVYTAGSSNASYNIAAARAGYDTLRFSYKWDGVDYSVSKVVYIDSIGKIVITGLKDNYCDYEGTATLKVLVENSSGSGNFSFSGPAVSFTNYGALADLFPTKTPPSVNPYTVSYTHISSVNNSGCRRTVVSPVTVNKSPTVNIINARTTINIKESPITLNGTPSAGTFSGKGVYKSGTSYVFDPLVAGLGDIEFTLAYTDSKGCSASKKDTLTVAAASGSILGINANNQYCYDGLKDQLTYSSSKPWSSGSFSGAGITNTASASADFDPAAAGKGDHDIVFTYSDLSGTVFNISATVNVDSLGKVAIQNLLAGDKYCNNDAPFELFTTPKGGTFTGPVISGSLIPLKALGDTAVTYTYLNVKTGCSITGRVPFRINPAPSVSFIPSDKCIENSTDSIHFVNKTVSADKIKDWLWSFSDANGTGLSSKSAPAYIFKTGGQHLVTLTATTLNNCSVKVDSTFDLGVKPIADFYWRNECYHPNESLQLFDTTFSTSTVASRTWNFFDGAPPLTGLTATYPKTASGYLKVQYIVNTIYKNCADTVTKNIFIRPSVKLESDSYFQDFETGNGGWVKYEDTGNSWSFGKPNRTVINAAASGNNAWFTNYPLANQKIESSSIVSPCFDFSSSQRPMISLKLWRQFDLTRDGAALQYKVKDEKNWHYVGTLEDGINWYNSAVIKGKPGGDPLGWTIKDNSWIESRHTLDDLKNKEDVKLRIVYGSDGTSTDNDGIAFDDIWIGERSRKVLLEHFENSSSTTSRDATAMVNNIVSGKSKDVINIQYHTNFPGTDPFYDENPGDASARILFYGLIKAPYSFLDGGNDKLNYAKNYDYNLANIDSNDVTRRSLINPRFDISLTSTVSGGILTVSGKLTALETLSSDNLTLFITVTEKKNTNHIGSNGETVFYNVFRKSIPDAGGISLKKTWTKGETYTLTEKTWVIEKIQNSSDIEVISFIQDNVKREIFQAASITEPNVVVGIENLFGGKETDFALYPNPARDKLTIAFAETLSHDTDIRIYDVRGVIVKSYKVGSGQKEFTIDNPELRGGIYLVRVSSGKIDFGFKKLIITGE